jgi:hypothetical protein
MNNNQVLLKEKTEKILITPQIAKEWLSRNKSNRKLRPYKTEAYARTMKAGLWLLTNQGIGLDLNGNLIDGQHRLSACVMANTAFLSNVTTGLVPGAQEVIDCNIARSIPDQLHMFSGETNANQKVAIVTLIVGAIRGIAAVSMSIDTTKKVLDLYSDEIEFILSDKGQSQALKYSPALTGFVFAAKVDLDKAVSFKDKYFKGYNLSIGDPALTFRNFMLQRDKTGNGGSGYRKTILCYSTTAMMHHFLNKPLKRLTTSTNGLDYFLNRQKNCVNMINEWFDL